MNAATRRWYAFAKRRALRLGATVTGSDWRMVIRAPAGRFWTVTGTRLLRPDPGFISEAEAFRSIADLVAGGTSPSKRRTS